MSSNGKWHGKKFYFGFHKDIHVYENDQHLGDNLDADKLAAALEKTGADWVQTDSKGHPGYTSWFSKTPDASVGPGLKKDVLKVWRTATKKLGLPLHAHYSGVFDVAAGKKHPDWTVKGPDGKSIPDASWAGNSENGAAMCPRSPYLEKLMIPQMIEMIDNYGIDGFWIDGDLWKVTPCYCPKCRAAFTARTGLNVPIFSGVITEDWSVIAPFERDAALPSDWFKAIPATLKIADGNLIPTPVKAKAGYLNLAPLLGGTAEGKSALVYIPFQTDRAQKFSFGVGADWWVDAYLDGDHLFDTLADGNQSSPPLPGDHVKTVELPAGEHLMAIRFISGSSGSVLAVGIKPGEFNADALRQWMDFTRESFEEYVTRYCDAIHQHKPGTVIASNWLYTCQNPGEPKAPVDWLSGDLSFGVDACRTEARFISTRGKPWDIMMWAFTFTHGNLGSPGWTPVMKPVQMLEQEAATIVAMGGNVQVCENPFDGFREGRVVDWRMQRLGELSRFLHRRRSLCQDTESIRQVAVLHSEHHLRTMPGAKLWSMNLDSVSSAVCCLLECHYGVDMLDEWALFPCLAEFPAVVVPEQTYMSDAMVDALKNYVRKGGRLLVSGAAMFDRFGADFLGIGAGRLEEKAVYQVSIPGETVPIFSDPWRLLETGNAKTLGTLGTTSFLDEKLLPHPAAVIHRVGKGKVAYIPCNVFQDFKRNILSREYVREVMSALCGKLDITVEAPTCLDVILRRKGRKSIVHFINRSVGTPGQINGGPVDEIPLVGPLTITMRMAQAPQKVELAFEPGTLDWQYENGKLTIKVASVHIHAAAVVTHE